MATEHSEAFWLHAEQTISTEELAAVSGFSVAEIAELGNTIFVTMYVYGTDNQPTWFVGTGALQFTDSQGVNTYGGDWYRVTGPYYGATFNPAAVNAVPVGIYTYRELTVTTGQIS